MLEGRLIHKEEVDGQDVVFRYPRWRDLPQFIKMRQAFHREQIMAAPERTDRAVGCKRLSDILARMETGRARWLFVFLDGKLAGQGQVDIHSARLYATIGLALAREARGRGIGRLMMTLLEDEALKLKRDRLYLTVWSRNPPAYHLYKNLGYREIGRMPDWVPTRDGKGYSDMVHMIKNIDKSKHRSTRRRRGA